MADEQHVLVCLDSLLDTRLAIVSLLNPAAAVAVMTEDYYTRLSDDFEKRSGGLVTNVAYREAWDKRDSSVIQYARVTNIVLLLEELFKTLISNQINTPFCGDTKLTVNIWPYELSEAAMEMTLTCIQAYVGGGVKVEGVSMSPEELTPAWIKENLAAMVIYDYLPWLTAQDVALAKTPMPEIVVFMPALSYKGDPTKEECTFEGLGTVSPFAIVEQGFSVFFSVQMIDSGFFSIIRV